MDPDSESKLISLISQLITLNDRTDSDSESGSEWRSKITSLIIQIIFHVRSMDLDSLPKPESKLMSLLIQTVSLFNSMDLQIVPKTVSELISLVSQKVSIDSDKKTVSDSYFTSLLYQTLDFNQDLEIMSPILDIVSVVTSMNTEFKKGICLCPQLEVFISEGKFRVIGEVRRRNHKWKCFLVQWKKFSLKGENATHFCCRSCNGEYHKEYKKAPLNINHPLHQKHSLQLVYNLGLETRMCYCCDEDLIKVFYCCLACDYAMNIACLEKAPLLSISHPKWHEHTLSLFPRKASLTCDVCALADSNSPFYICPPCDFVVHLRCINLPRIIRICRHPHRIYHTSSFDKGDLSCGVCCRKIDNDYGGYSCTKDSCSYAAHSKCATQSNIWDGIDLEGEPEEIEEEEVEPFVRIRDRIIRHFCHDQHHLRLDENTGRDYDENKQCQACITPIYFGNVYFCVQCEFIIHESCANLSRKLYHPIHPHLLTLALKGGSDYAMDRCSACFLFLTAGFFYECRKEECRFKLHVQCSKICEPLVHESHVHPLFLTSKPGRSKICCVCQKANNVYRKVTFNCIECVDFAKSIHSASSVNPNVSLSSTVWI